MCGGSESSPGNRSDSWPLEEAAYFQAVRRCQDEIIIAAVVTITSSHQVPLCFIDLAQDKAQSGSAWN